MTLIALKQLYNRREYGLVAAGEVFDVEDRSARDLVSRGCAIRLGYETAATRAAPAPAIYEVKEGTAAPPFRDRPAADAEPPALAALRVAVRAVSDS